MSNFEVFQCSVCNRKIEKLVDQKRAPINKCTITYKCVGNLVKVSESDTKTMTGPAMDTTLTNWVQRGQLQQNTPESTKPSLVVINTAQDVLSVAIDSSVLASEIDFVFLLKRLTNTSYVEYFYNRPSNTVLISGQDDSSKRLALRFADTDMVIVYLNGVEQDPSTYDRTIPGRIVFKGALVDETNQIRVLVHKQDASTYVTLKFVRNDFATFKSSALSAWGNVDRISAGASETSYSIFTCNNVSDLQINSVLVLDHLVADGDPWPAEVGYFILADAPYSSYDRNLNNAISISKLMNTETAIEFKKDLKNSPKFYVDSGAILSMFPPISILSKIGDDVDSNKTNDSNTRLVNAYIT